MDSAYDHIQEESYPQDPTPQTQSSKDSPAPANNFQSEVQDAYKAISSSPWAARLGGFLGTVKKQGEQYYDGASKQATAGISTLIKHTRNISITADPSSATPASESTASTSKAPVANDPDAHPDRPDSLPADIVKEAEGMLSRFRSEAAKRLKDIEKAEDAADEALLKFGTNIRNFLREAVTIAPPADDANGQPGAVLFESKDISGKKVVHATRFDAQLHVIHSSLDSFLKDPVSPEWEGWRKSFNVEKKTEDIAKDLEKHAELRTAMEKCVPEKVEYGTFWERYYFLRHVIESEEQRRREMLKASTSAPDEEVSWDEDSEDDSEEDEDEKDVKVAKDVRDAKVAKVAKDEKDEEDSSDEDSEEEDSEEEDSEDDSDDDSDDDQPTSTTPKPASNLAASKETLKPAASTAPTSLAAPSQPRRSNDEKSVADSDASYDLVSGATSRAPGSPQDKKKVVVEESDEEDWE